jgi:CshA-type fibril repeat protein
VASPVTDTTTPGEPATGNVLDNVTPPPGTTEAVTGFSVPGSDTVYPAGSTVPLVDPLTGTVTGTMQVNPDGTYVFTPAPGYVGPVPTVDVVVTSSDGQSKEVPLTVTVNPVLVDASENLAVTAGSGPLTTNVLDNAVVPPGTTATVTSFSLPGSSVVYPAGPTPVTVTDPVTGKVTGTVVVQPDGTVTFTPAPGFTGQAPAISYTVESSDGQVSPGALTVTVLPAGTPASAVYSDAADTASTPMGQNATGNVLANANVPSGQTAQVTGFSIAGSTTVYPAGSTVTLTDPLTGEPIGTLTISASGAYTFDPVDGYVGPTPAVNVYSKTSTGTTAVSSLTLDVLPGDRPLHEGS